MDRENKNQCFFCNAIFSTKAASKIHEDSIHKNIKHNCQDCGKQYTKKTNLARHINNVHKDIKYKCDQCDKDFTDSGKRSRHIKSVHEQKKYLCTLCDYQDRVILQDIKNQFIKVSSIYVQYVDFKHHIIVVLLHIFSQNTKEKNISVILVIRNIQIHQVSGIIINQFMKV